ncbi:hypothetical protein ABI59_10400 [Acidobacteria bacterium Mor1]|nr:hypothetical protein ABI59_10400 [Acidobacteria bacterium Mor1]
MAQDTEAVKGQEPVFDDKALVEKVVRDVQQAKRDAKEHVRTPRRRKFGTSFVVFCVAGLAVIAGEAWYLSRTAPPAPQGSEAAYGAELSSRQMSGAVSIADAIIVNEAVRSYEQERGFLPADAADFAPMLPEGLSVRASAGSVGYDAESGEFRIRVSDPDGPDIVFDSEQNLMRPFLSDYGEEQP